ncbi:MAG: hypothetical protein CM15mP113_0940 [Pseudomonadota bacterium]|nr:MAG: hypothetical protein CM15mP113_0940 [Pseudomonadota bacterium]
MYKLFTPMTKTQRLINRIEQKESFYDIAFLCEDFQTFIDEISEWGVDHIGGVDFDDPEVNRGMMNAYFASFGCTLTTPTPAANMLKDYLTFGRSQTSLLCYNLIIQGNALRLFPNVF